jgi:hypothetical protein
MRKSGTFRRRSLVNIVVGVRFSTLCQIYVAPQIRDSNSNIISNLSPCFLLVAYEGPEYVFPTAAHADCG